VERIKIRVANSDQCTFLIVLEATPPFTLHFPCVKTPHAETRGDSFRGGPFFLVDPFVKPDSHKLGVWNTFLTGKAFYQRDIKWVQTKGNWMTGRTWNFKGLCLIQQILNLLGTLSSNGNVPFLGFFLEVIPYFFWESAHFFILLK